ncbi:TadE/TadG family type IV pilus assembly protein [Duganella qianjiadongensis]|uniref:Pilus assembly protein n=1 Tax=Duganella qianjiadongensis TaxID=2692176 RepID=A0ABW9VSI4_9BURK|nr:TadE/TadG family type IV pilus assembly protein [Duganella qianjiadongensis]MYM41282.1 pilus assembly protein [Duganella qianjiadongensis]
MPLAVQQRGTLAVEFAVVLVIFLLLLFGLLAVAQGLYVVNTVQEVSRRAAVAAAKTDFSDSAALQQIRQQAVFRSTPGLLAFAAPVSDAHVRIDYLSIAKAGDGSLSLLPMAVLPASPAASQVACTADPYSSQCVQFVRVRLCDAADTATCQPVQLQCIFPWVQLNIALGTAPTIVKADGLGYVASPP